MKSIILLGLSAYVALLAGVLYAPVVSAKTDCYAYGEYGVMECHNRDVGGPTNPVYC